ncbi:endoglucanase [Alternaria burnsii]|uniref:cellulase n=1 Tax=Alternaria burnsii TaxID=1187904 RepID=A0A8H7BBP4_9PLEO|nr:endoglucanase [Alternaria burnsii]KAF7679082.1 endoglucanase [Alternaria burnsii]
MSTRPASAVEELDDLNKSLVAQSGTIVKTKSRSVLIKIGVEVWLVAYRLHGYRMKSCYLRKIARKVTVQKRVQSNIVHTNRARTIASNVAVLQRESDLGEDQFNIAIPGGGEGAIRGCTKQYGGQDVWGEDFGGVAHRDDCEALPTALHAGCYWRFDWFGAADNPTINWEKVTCPEALVLTMPNLGFITEIVKLAASDYG